MSESDLRVLAEDLPLHLPAETLKQRTAALVRRYVQRRSPRIARAIVRHSGALALHPALRDQPEQRRAFCHLNRHWRLLADQCAAAAA